ncbi:MAG: hypothetical protein M1819_007007 [Sarea resinae]|nr:MAG: hypothetical protein M1819_007007 [Sarea resinae]
MSTEPIILKFYTEPQSAKDFKGRTLEAILGLSDKDLEYSHDFIQILFPLPEGSPFNLRAPVIDRQVFEAFHSRPELRAQLHSSFVRMLKFYGFETHETAEGKAEVTILHVQTLGFNNLNKRFDHNHLRITRIIRSLRVLGLEEEALAFYKALKKVAETSGKISAKSIMFWGRAAHRPLHLAPEFEDDQVEGGADFLREFEESRGFKE